MNRIETTRLNRSGQVHIPTSGKFIVPCKFLITLLRFKEKRVFIGGLVTEDWREKVENHIKKCWKVKPVGEPGKRYVTGRQTVSTVALFKIWNLWTNQVGKKFECLNWICWEDSQISFLSLNCWMFWFSFGWQRFKIYLDFSLFCWCPLAFY